jgi:hypothetical protein
MRPIGFKFLALVATFGVPVAGATQQGSPELSNRLQIEDEIIRHSLPTNAQIDAVENALAHKPCIGNLDHWARRFTYALDYEHGRIDDDVISFDFREAGRFGYHKGRKIGRPRDFAEVDDRQFLLAIGTYRLSAGKPKMAAFKKTEQSFSSCNLVKSRRNNNAHLQPATRQPCHR